jgi:hypothetical protein
MFEVVQRPGLTFRAPDPARPLPPISPVLGCRGAVIGGGHRADLSLVRPVSVTTVCWVFFLGGADAALSSLGAVRCAIGATATS